MDRWIVVPVPIDYWCSSPTKLNEQQGEHTKILQGELGARGRRYADVCWINTGYKDQGV